MDDKTIGKIIRAIRLKKGKSATFVGKNMGYATPSGYSRIETGETTLSFTKALQLAKILEVEVIDLSNEDILRESRNYAFDEQAATSA